MTDQPENHQRKILVLGSSFEVGEITSVRWDHIPEALNVADYDTVILDFTPFEFDAIAKSINIDSIPRYDSFARLLFSHSSEVIVIGKPFFHVGDNPFLEFDWWLPITPKFLSESGDTIILVDPEYLEFFDNVASWSFCLRGWNNLDERYFTSYMREAGLPRAEVIRPRVYPIANNRYDRPIAFTCTFTVESRGGGHLGESGFLTWLPPTTKVTSIEAIQIILGKRYGILRRQKSPSWVDGYTLPDEIQLQERISTIEDQVGTLADELEKTRKGLLRVQRHKGILYETGEAVLEPLVLDVLKILGGEIELPKAKGKEDGRLKDPNGRLGTIEIKGRSGPLRLDDVRQIHQWVSDRIAYEGTRSKGLLIANLYRDDPPSGRKKVFPPNCIQASENFNISLVTTSQVHNALVQHQNGELNHSEFWDSIFRANGVCELPEL